VRHVSGERPSAVVTFPGFALRRLGRDAGSRARGKQKGPRRGSGRSRREAAFRLSTTARCGTSAPPMTGAEREDIIRQRNGEEAGAPSDADPGTTPEQARPASGPYPPPLPTKNDTNLRTPVRGDAPQGTWSRRRDPGPYEREQQQQREPLSAGVLVC
jgi:hypothetical protein